MRPSSRSPPIERKRASGTGNAIGSFKEDTWEGLRYLWTRRGMRNFVLTITGLNFLLAPVLVLLPL